MQTTWNNFFSVNLDLWHPHNAFPPLLFWNISSSIPIFLLQHQIRASPTYPKNLDLICTSKPSFHCFHNTSDKLLKTNSKLYVLFIYDAGFSVSVYFKMLVNKKRAHNRLRAQGWTWEAPWNWNYDNVRFSDQECKDDTNSNRFFYERHLLWSLVLP